MAISRMLTIEHVHLVRWHRLLAILLFCVYVMSQRLARCTLVSPLKMITDRFLSIGITQAIILFERVTYLRLLLLLWRAHALLIQVLLVAASSARVTARLSLQHLQLAFYELCGPNLGWVLRLQWHHLSGSD